MPLRGPGARVNVALRTRNIVSLCAGVGGLELGILLALHCRAETGRGICYVEREASAAASLVASMEGGWFHPAPVWSDLLTFDARPWRGVVHILASGDPCQDNSVAGKRAGADGERFLAPEVCRIAEECRPDLIFRENVPGNAAEQLSAISPPLERLGYRVAAGIFSSSETGNTMRRERLFIMAERIGDGHGRQHGSGEDPASSGEAQGAWDQRQRLRNVAGGEGQDLGGAKDERHERSGGARRRRARSSDADQPVARSTLQRCGEARGHCERSEERAGSPDGALGRADNSDAQGQRADNRAARRQDQRRPTGLSGRAILPPAVIPGPNDNIGWLNVLDRWPELQPALSKEEAESHLRRGVDAMAHRVERLRATGNGVDPVVGAYAFLCLSALLAEARSGKTLLMEAA